MKPILCPKCGTDVGKPYATWTMKGKGNVLTEVQLYRCPKCRKRFRKGVRLENIVEGA